MPSSPQRSGLLGRLGLVLASTLAGLLALELGLRAWDGFLGHWTNLVLDARTVLATSESARFVHDGRVGYVPRGGLRSNGSRPAPTGPVILAVGDSYTYGEEVGDGETWPAALEQLTGRRVANGGASGYGFDQTVLRAEALANELTPSAIVVSFIADDIQRTEMRRLWGAEKPYFDVSSNELVLRNVPVPPRLDPRSTLSPWQWTLGYSYLFDLVLRRLDLLHNWFGDHVRVHPPGTGERVACLLTGRLGTLQKASGAKVILLAQYDPVVWQTPRFAAEQRRLTSGILDCARQRGLEVIDSFDALAAHPGGPRSLYVTWHMNAEGNRLIAGLLRATATGGAR